MDPVNNIRQQMIRVIRSGEKLFRTQNYLVQNNLHDKNINVGSFLDTIINN